MEDLSRLDFARVLRAYPPLEAQDPASLPVARVDAGLINHTFTLGASHILQRLHPTIFRPQVNDDIAALTPHLAAAHIPVPALVPTLDQRRCVELHDGPEAGVWRVMTRLPGKTLHKLQDPHQARAGGEVLGRFHRALDGLGHTFAFQRPGAHDTPRHMARLREALAAHPHHRLLPQVEALAQDLLARWEGWGPLPSLPPRIIHGDPKVSNLLFGDDGSITGVIDLDTMAWDTVQVELGDALRSWCNASDEDDPAPLYRLDIHRATLDGYLAATQGWLTDDERASLDRAAPRICLELCARFAADALHESYFGWNPRLAPTRGDHNLLRARGQLALAASALDVLG